MYEIKDNLKLYIFDFCGTLYRGNTSLLFLKYLFRNADITYKIKYLIYGLSAKILKNLKIIDGNDYMKIRIKALKSYNIVDIKDHTICFYKDVLNNLENRESFELLNQLNRKGKEIIILSNTFEFLLEFFPLKNKVKLSLGSELDIKDSIIQGNYKSLVNQIGKLKILNKYYSYEDIRNSMFITDNKQADSDIFLFVDHPILLK